MADLDTGTTDSGIIPSGSSLSGSQWGTLGAGALGLAGLGYFASGGPTQVMSIPGYAQANAMVPGLEQQSALTFSQGQQLLGGAAQGYAMAQRGELTAPQQAKLDQDRQALQNQAAQTYASMGRSGADTSKISTQANIDQAMAVEANAFIQSTIALAGSQMGAATQLMGLSGQEASAATGILMQEGAAQVQLNKQYSDSMTAAFGAVAKIFGAVLPGIGKLV